MARKTKSMSQIKQLLLLRQQGKGYKTIARTLGISKNTVKTYLQKLDALTSVGKEPIRIAELVRLDNPILEAKFHPGNPAYKDDRYEHFKVQTDYFLKELKRKGVNKRLLWEEYRSGRPDSYSYSQFCFHLGQQQTASRPSLVLEHQPADKLYIDFAGKKLHYIDKGTGEAIDCQVFVACLPYSDYCFVMTVPSQSTEDFIYALCCCLSFLGGVPLALVPDNLKAAVVQSNRYEPKINQVLEDLASHYGTTVVPARVRKPRDKALVENQVKLIYSRVYAKLRNRIFFDVDSLNQAIAQKVKEHNQTRMQQKPYCREERFLSKEKQHLLPLPVERFEMKYYKELTAAKNNHIYLSDDKHYYSVPYKLIGQKVKVIYTRSMVYIFAKGGQVAVHIRGYKQGGYTTEKDHLCSQHRHYRDRSPEYYLQQAGKKSSTLRELVSLIFNQNRYPEQLYKTCDGLFSLHRLAEAEAFEKACRIAITHQVYSYRFIKNILENHTTDLQQEPSDKTLPEHKNLRGKQYYQQLELNYKTNESD